MKYIYKNEEYTMHKHPLYHTWKSMNDRCYRKYEYNRGNYYGRVRVCARWLRPCFGGEDPKAFSNFCDDMGERPEGSSLDRIDPNGDYCPENCRWASRAIQAHNHCASKSCIAIKYNYKTDKYGNKKKVMYQRIDIVHNGKRYTQHIKKNETPAETFARLKRKVYPELENWDAPNALTR